MNKTSKIIITGAAGLVGQNLVILLKQSGYSNLIAIDKHKENNKIFRKINNVCPPWQSLDPQTPQSCLPKLGSEGMAAEDLSEGTARPEQAKRVEGLNSDIQLIEADLAEQGAWEEAFNGAEAVIQLHAQIGAKEEEPFIRNNIEATKQVLAAIKKYQVPYLVHISSSVVISVADDYYTNTKKEQEKLVASSGITHCSLRPTLMFGWFDRKHIGWLSRFMQKVPIFPVPGSGKYIRQPLYALDFCRIIKKCLETQPQNKTYDIIGKEQMYYIDIIRALKKVQKLKTLIIRFPYPLFYLLLKLYALFDKNPPFTASQLKALCAGDIFKYFDWEKEFNLQATPFEKALQETFLDDKYSKYVLKF
ncbi:MAG: NAD-dependent epimerase/dehydratase family protein [Candidatus Gracilibacteria bacterium]|nr:NAD-dependent epimerase/dehydratase family protein [Candidatus Gracilibacteria bacterium]